MAQKVLKQEQIAAADAFTISNEPLASIDLMERASQRFVACLLNLYPQPRPVLVLAGPGNNGGDGLAIARILAEKDWPVSVFILPANRRSVDNELNAQRLPDPVRQVDFEGLFTALAETSLVIDALFGTGLSRPVNEGQAAAVIQLVNNPAVPVVAVDLPSGLPTDEALWPDGLVVQATHTITFQQPKLSQLLPDSGRYCGQLHVVDIGLHKDYLSTAHTNFWFTEEHDVRWVARQRPAFAHKGQFGRLLLVGGSFGKAGAVALAARAALRTGVGLISALAPTSCQTALQACVPELMLAQGGLGHNQLEELVRKLLPPNTAMAIGPGLGTHEGTADVLEDLLNSQPVPLVMDADGLNLLARYPHFWPMLKGRAILTPHLGEMARLVGPAENSKEYLEKARQLARQHELVVVLKGAYSAVCLPDGQVWFNPTGNPGMAKGGSGDCLTGIMGALLAQHGVEKLAEVAKAAVYLHGLAADEAVKHTGQQALLPSDVIEALPLAWRKLG